MSRATRRPRAAPVVADGTGGRARRGGTHQPGTLEDTEVLADGGQAHGEGLASSVTVASPSVSRSTIARRVGSAKAANTSSRRPTRL